jgi:hypothetical protein
MAHFAEIDNQNLVTRVLVVSNNHEARGQEFLANDLGLGGRWIQTSYNGNFRKNFAGIGFTFDEQRDAFIPPKPFQKWILNEETCQWESPIPYPNDGLNYYWDDEIGQWVEV